MTQALTADQQRDRPMTKLQFWEAVNEILTARGQPQMLYGELNRVWHVWGRS